MTAMHGIRGLADVIDGAIWVGADRLTATTSNALPSFIGAGGTARTPAFLVDATTPEGVAGTIRLPASWATVDVDMWWSNAGAGAGDVVWRGDRGVLTVGSAPPAVTSNTLAAITAPAQNVVTQTRIFTGIAVPTAGALFTIGALRGAADAADTLANDAAIVGFFISKAS